jgi:hypothetical protein
MTRQRLTHDDAMTFWRARDIYRVHATVRGIVLLFFLLELLRCASRGQWLLGLGLIGVQGGILYGLWRGWRTLWRHVSERSNR